MNERYALFIWSSYALTALVLVWNLWSPRLARGAVMRRLAENDAAEGIEE